MKFMRRIIGKIAITCLLLFVFNIVGVKSGLAINTYGKFIFDNGDFPSGPYSQAFPLTYDSTQNSYYSTTSIPNGALYVFIDCNSSDSLWYISNAEVINTQDIPYVNAKFPKQAIPMTTGDLIGDKCDCVRTDTDLKTYTINTSTNKCETTIDMKVFSQSDPSMQCIGYKIDSVTGKKSFSNINTKENNYQSVVADSFCCTTGQTIVNGVCTDPTPACVAKTVVPDFGACNCAEGTSSGSQVRDCSDSCGGQIASCSASQTCTCASGFMMKWDEFDSKNGNKTIDFEE